jgi:hypothetical protein
VFTFKIKKKKKGSENLVYLKSLILMPFLKSWFHAIPKEALLAFWVES